MDGRKRRIARDGDPKRRRPRGVLHTRSGDLGSSANVARKTEEKVGGNKDTVEGESHDGKEVKSEADAKSV